MMRHSIADLRFHIFAPRTNRKDSQKDWNGLRSALLCGNEHLSALDAHAMETYSLTSKARPRLQSEQETRLYDAIKELGGGPLTLYQIVKQCEFRRYGTLLRKEAPISSSVSFHLRNWLRRGIVEKERNG